MRWWWVACFMAISPWAWSQTPGAVSIPDDPNVHALEIRAPNASTAQKVRTAAEALAFDLDAVVEFEDEDDAG